MYHTTRVSGYARDVQTCTMQGLEALSLCWYAIMREFVAS
jgi:hypothetical protein